MHKQFLKIAGRLTICNKCKRAHTWRVYKDGAVYRISDETIFLYYSMYQKYYN